MALGPPRIPPEICDQIIDHLWNDLPALKACSLTCRSWLPATHVHMFHTLDVRSDEDGFDIEGECLHKYDSIAGWIAPLSFWDNCFGVASDPRMEHWQRSGFPVIKSVQMNGVMVDRTDMEFIPSIFPNISSLSLDQLEPPPTKRLENKALARMDTERRRGTHPVPELNVMSARNVSTFWILRVVEYERLLNLEIPIRIPSDAESVGALLKRAADSPRHLTLNLHPRYDPSSTVFSAFSHLQIPPDTPIRTLCLRCPIHIPEFDEILPNMSLVPLLSRFPSPSLTRIDIVLALHSAVFADVAVVNWRDLDAQLAHMAHGTSLAKVVVRVVGKKKPSERRTNRRAELDALTRLLPLLCASGIHVGIQYDRSADGVPLIERWFCRGKVYSENIGAIGGRRARRQARRGELDAKILSHADSCGNEVCTYTSRSAVSIG